jgi:heptosyltransferase-2
VVINMAGLTTVMELAALIERCRVFVTNDTGPMHLACAVSVPVAAIIGPTDPEATGPLGTAAIIRKDVACAPCLRRECPTDHQCMTLIGVEEVYQAVRGMLTS